VWATGLTTMQGCGFGRDGAFYATEYQVGGLNEGHRAAKRARRPGQVRPRVVLRVQVGRHSRPRTWLCRSGIPACHLALSLLQL